MILSSVGIITGTIRQFWGISYNQADFSVAKWQVASNNQRRTNWTLTWSISLVKAVFYYDLNINNQIRIWRKEVVSWVKLVSDKSFPIANLESLSNLPKWWERKDIHYKSLHVLHVIIQNSQEWSRKCDTVGIVISGNELINWKILQPMHGTICN